MPMSSINGARANANALMRSGVATIGRYLAVLGCYLVFLLSQTPTRLLCLRVFPIPGLPVFAEALLLAATVALAFLVGRLAIGIDVSDDWRRGLIKLAIGLFAIATFAAPFALRVLALFLDVLFASAGC